MAFPFGISGWILFVVGVLMTIGGIVYVALTPASTDERQLEERKTIGTPIIVVGVCFTVIGIVLVMQFTAAPYEPVPG